MAWRTGWAITPKTWVVSLRNLLGVVHQRRCCDVSRVLVGLMHNKATVQWHSYSTSPWTTYRLSVRVVMPHLFLLEQWLNGTVLKLPWITWGPRHDVHPVVRRHLSFASYIVVALMMRSLGLRTPRWTVQFSAVLCLMRYYFYAAVRLWSQIIITSIVITFAALTYVS